MTKQRYINTKFWDDSYIIELDPIEKLLFLYFLTNPLTNISGVYEISLRRIAFDTGIDSEMVLKILTRFKNEGKAYYIEGYIGLQNFVKNQSLNPSVVEGIKREISLIPKPILNKLRQARYRLSQEGLPNLTLLNLTKEETKCSSFKKYYDGLPVRKQGGKLWVIPAGGGKWKEYVGPEKDLTDKP